MWGGALTCNQLTGGLHELLHATLAALPVCAATILTRSEDAGHEHGYSLRIGPPPPEVEQALQLFPRAIDSLLVKQDSGYLEWAPEVALKLLQDQGVPLLGAEEPNATEEEPEAADKGSFPHKGPTSYPHWPVGAKALDPAPMLLPTGMLLPGRPEGFAVRENLGAAHELAMEVNRADVETKEARGCLR